MNILLSVLSGILLTLSFPKPGLFYLSWVALVPFIIACLRPTSIIQKIINSLFFGLVAYSGILYWIVITFKTAGLPVVIGICCLFLLSMYLSLYIVLFSLLVKPASGNKGIFIYPLLLSCAWVVLEYTRTYMFTGFPWGILGYTQWNCLPVIQITGFTGVYGVSFLIMYVNTSIGYLLVNPAGKKSVLALIIPVILFMGNYAYGRHAIDVVTGKTSKPVKAVILQGNIGQYKKWDDTYKTEIKKSYASLIGKITQKEVDLIVWPETAVPGYLFFDEDINDWIKQLVRLTGCSHLTGSMDYLNGNYYNSCFLISPENIRNNVITRENVQQYSKIHLVPFGETIPFKPFLGKYIKVLNELGDTSSGNRFTVFSNNNTGCFSASICFESIFPGITRQFSKNPDVGFIVNITNDAWYLTTSAPYQHFSFNVFRAVENRKPVIRAANTGISGLIDKTGKIVVISEIFTQAYQYVEINPNYEMTFYTRFGDVFVMGCFILLIIIVKGFYQKNILTAN